MDNFKLNLQRFQEHMAQEKAQGVVTQDDCMRALGRVFHMLEVEGYNLANEASDPAVLVAVYIFDIHKDLLNLPILAPHYSWTRKVLDALKSFCDWQKMQVSKLQLMSDSSQWAKYKAALEQLSIALTGGVQKRVLADKHRRALERRIGDAQKLEHLPVLEEMKGAVMKAMATLHHLLKASDKKHPLPIGQQAQANAALAGIIWLNGFGGRKMEWEEMSRAHVHEQFSKGLDYLVCMHHKTSHVYGNLAKWVAPGTEKAIETYLALPCRPGVHTLFAPASPDTKMVSIPKALDRFCQLYLPANCTKPTVNLMRKWYHTELCRLTRTCPYLLHMVVARAAAQGCCQ